MLMTIRFQNGRRAEAVLLAASPDRMRIVTSSHSDTIELRRVGACWLAGEVAEIEIEALIPLAGTDASGFCAEVYPRTIAAASVFAFA
jgi:hypothetical protein